MSNLGVEQILSTAVMPAQFQQQSRPMTSERRLVMAVLYQAIHDLRTFWRPNGPKNHQRLYREALRWVVSNDRSWEFSFLNVCDVLDLSVDMLRAELFGENAKMRRAA